jgi:hypothetical protein
VKVENYDTREALFRNRSVTGTRKGVQTIALPATAQLQPGQKYVALVALRCSAAEARAEDPVTRAGIIRSTEAIADNCGSDASCAFRAAADRGTWYDAMDAAFGTTANAETRATGIDWLRGAGLTDAAESLSK